MDIMQPSKIYHKCPLIVTSTNMQEYKTASEYYLLLPTAHNKLKLQKVFNWQHRVLTLPIMHYSYICKEPLSAEVRLPVEQGETPRQARLD